MQNLASSFLAKSHYLHLNNYKLLKMARKGGSGASEWGHWLQTANAK